MKKIFLVEASGWVNGKLIHLVSDFHSSIEECYDDINNIIVDIDSIHFEEFCY